MFRNARNTQQYPISGVVDLRPRYASSSPPASIPPMSSAGALGSYTLGSVPVAGGLVGQQAAQAGVLTAAFSIQAPTVKGAALVTPGVIVAAFSVKAVTVAAGAALGVTPLTGVFSVLAVVIPNQRTKHSDLYSIRGTVSSDLYSTRGTNHSDKF